MKNEMIAHVRKSIMDGSRQRTDHERVHPWLAVKLGRDIVRAKYLGQPVHFARAVQWSTCTVIHDVRHGTASPSDCTFPGHCIGWIRNGHAVHAGKGRQPVYLATAPADDLLHAQAVHDQRIGDQ
mgnify:CR=1 FL=1